MYDHNTRESLTPLKERHNQDSKILLHSLCPKPPNQPIKPKQPERKPNPHHLSNPAAKSSLLHSDGRRPIARKQRVDPLVPPFELELLAQLLLDRRLDRLEHVGEDAEVGRVGLVVVAALEDAGADEAGVPAVAIAACYPQKSVKRDGVGGLLV